MSEQSEGEKDARITALEAELRQAKEPETAIGDVLRLIRRSPSDVPSVVRAMLDRALELLEAESGALALVDGDEIRSGVVNTAGNGETRRPIEPESDFDSAVIRGGRLLQFSGAVEELEKAFPVSGAHHRRRGRTALTVMAVPLRQGDRVVGVLDIARDEARPFSDADVGLVQTFADEAAIAIENAWLFGELEERNRAVSERWSAKRWPVTFSV